MKVQRNIFVGDIHGCIDEFDELIKTISYNKSKDRLILLGDLIDRGPDSVGVIKRAQELKAEAVMGNHEDKFIKWINNTNYGEVSTIKKFYLKLSDQDIQYIINMPTYIKVGNIIAVHAGLRPGISLENQSKEDLMYLRYTDSKNTLFSLKKVHKLGKEVLGAHLWTEYWKGPESIVYGHNVYSRNYPYIEEPSPGVFCYGLDTGCCFGGKLTAWILENKEIVQVTAQKTYYQPRF